MFIINGESWGIFTVSPSNYRLRRSDGGYTIGVCDNNEKRIYLNNQLEGYMLKKVLCHEITHAAMFSYDIDLTLEEEELLANLIATYGQEIMDITNNIFSHLKR